MRQFHPKLVAVENEKLAEEIRVRTEDLGIPVMSGMDGLIAVATEEHAQMVVTARIMSAFWPSPTFSSIYSVCPQKCWVTTSMRIIYRVPVA